MSSVPELIRCNHGAILARWRSEAAHRAEARGLVRPELETVVPTYLIDLADAGEELGRFTGARRVQVERHFAARVRQGLHVAEIVEELGLLGWSIADTWEAGAPNERPVDAEIRCLLQELHLAAVAVTEMFARYVAEEEEADKRLQQLIERVADEALRDDASALRARLADVLAVVMETMRAQSTTLLMYSADSRTLELAASVGAAGDELERYASTLPVSSFGGTSPPVAASSDAAVDPSPARLTTEVAVSDALRRHGIQSLLGFRLPPRHRLTGVLYVGLADTRTFTSREVCRLQSLGTQLTLHLDNARLDADRREHLRKLAIERELRERFVSVLAHDLRGPLSAARAGAETLLLDAELLEDERGDVARLIDRNITRADRMIHDLLDANRLRAGERLPLQIAECDLLVIARDVYDEVARTSRHSLMLEAEGPVVGFWGGEVIRRALWNLVTNAIKYGAQDRPITIAVARAAERAQVTVHDWGSSLASEDPEELFRPFARAASADAGAKKGWGLGLTLVHGCATAHGGRVHVQSTPESGTTFTLDLPRDARPFQPRSEPPPSGAGRALRAT